MLYDPPQWLAPLTANILKDPAIIYLLSAPLMSMARLHNGDNICNYWAPKGS